MIELGPRWVKVAPVPENNLIHFREFHDAGDHRTSRERPYPIAAMTFVVNFVVFVPFVFQLTDQGPSTDEPNGRVGLDGPRSAQFL